MDGFASRANAACKKFIAKWPQLGAEGVNFFAQELRSTEVYYCCPPVHEAGHLLRSLAKACRVTAVVVLPAWQGSSYWPLLQDGADLRPEIKKLNGVGS